MEIVKLLRYNYLVKNPVYCGLVASNFCY